MGRLRDIVAWGEEAIGHLDGRAVDAFVSDRQAYLAAFYCVQVVGEAAWALSEGAKHRSTIIPWPLVAAMRHRLVHDYGRTDPGIVYRVLTESLPTLIAEAHRLLTELDSARGDIT